MDVRNYSSEALKQLQAFADKQGQKLMDDLQESGYDVVLQETGFGERYLKVSLRSKRYTGNDLNTIFRIVELYEQPLDPFVYINKTMLELVRDAL